MENVFLQDFLPYDLAFDMNMHILKFMPDGCHPFCETHVQEHGAYVLGGQGMYLLGEDWVQVKKEDFIWFGPFCQQATYATGPRALLLHLQQGHEPRRRYLNGPRSSRSFGGNWKMTLTVDFGPRDIYKQVERTGIKGRHLIFIDDLSKEELANLFITAEMLEPFYRGRIPLLEGKVLCTQFFQPSTRTRFSHETAMYRLGGNVITESNPLVSSSAAKGESLYERSARDRAVRRRHRPASPRRGGDRDHRAARRQNACRSSAAVTAT